MATIKILLYLAPKLNWSLTQLDKSNSFLNGDLEEEIYMELPPGYSEIQGKSVSSTVVCRLHNQFMG